MLQFASLVIDSVLYGAWLFVIAVGLTLIYGVMKILNVAHGSLYALGAYTTASFVGFWIGNGYPPIGSLGALALAALAVGVIGGVLIERGLLRFMYGKDETVLMLATYALFLILEDVIKLAWGVESYFVPDPVSVLGNVEFGDMIYPTYNFLILLVAVIAGGLIAWALRYTRNGRLLLAVIHDTEMSTAMGINIYRFYTVTFTAGAVLAALGGAITAPTLSVVPGLGVEVIVLAFAVVVTGGLGSMLGAAIGALVIGFVRSLAVYYLPQMELFSIYLVMAAVLIFWPKGLISSFEARKI